MIHRNPLGKDKFYNRYWWFHRDGRIFVESSDSKEWGYYSSKEEVLMLLNYFLLIILAFFFGNSILTFLISLMR